MNWIKNRWGKFKDVFSNQRIHFEMFSFIIGCFALIVTGFFGIFSIYDKFVRIEITEIPVELAPFYTNSHTDLQRQYLSLLADANENLRQKNNKYRFYPVVHHSGEYMSLFSNLKQKDGAYMISVSAFTHLLFEAGKLPYKKEDFALIGYKKFEGRITLHSRMIWNKRLGLQLDEVIGSLLKLKVSSINNRFENQHRSPVILTEEEYSTTCHVIPQIYLLEKGIDIRNQYYHKRMTRVEMIDSIIKSEDLNVGFTSIDDYNYSLTEKQRNDLDYFDIETPIPYDAFYAKASWWNNLSSNDRNAVLQSLESSDYGMVAAPDYTKIGWLNFKERKRRAENNRLRKKEIELYRYDIFKLYVGSAVVCYDILSQDPAKIVLPNERADILDLQSEFAKCDKVKLYEFTIGDKNCFDNTMQMKYIGLAKIEKISDNIYQIAGVHDSVVKKQSIHALPFSYK